MKIMKTSAMMLFLLSAAVGVSLAQTSEEAGSAAQQRRHYRLDFVVKELTGGKVVNARAYSTEIEEGRVSRSSIRAGSRVPIAAGGESGGVTYADLGVNIDSSGPDSLDGRLALSVTADISSLAPDTPPIAVRAVVRQNRWQGNVVVPLGKPTVLFSSDGLTSETQMQVELTATLIE